MVALRRWTHPSSTLLLLLACGLTATAQQARAHRDGPRPATAEEKAATLEAHTVTLPVLEAGQMSAANRTLLEQRELDVSRAAAFYGFDISDSRWVYRQVVCRALPDHLVLSFENDSVSRGASHFVAVVPANAQQKVQVVTDYAHGLLPFRTPWEKTAAYEAFNHMTAEDRGEKAMGPDSHWLNLGMCFAALTGQVPLVAMQNDSVEATEALTKRNGSTPIIRIATSREAEVDFSDISGPQTVNWRLTFDPGGRLVKAQRDVVGPLKTVVAPLSPVVPAINPE